MNSDKNPSTEQPLSWEQFIKLWKESSKELGESEDLPSQEELEEAFQTVNEELKTGQFVKTKDYLQIEAFLEKLGLDNAKKSDQKFQNNLSKNSPDNPDHRR